MIQTGDEVQFVSLFDSESDHLVRGHATFPPTNDVTFSVKSSGLIVDGPRIDDRFERRVESHGRYWLVLTEKGPLWIEEPWIVEHDGRQKEKQRIAETKNSLSQNAKPKHIIVHFLLFDLITLGKDQIMKANTTNGQERQNNGQYGSKLDAVCKCGHTLGEHSASRPYSQDDGFTCPGFKKAKKG